MRWVFIGVLRTNVVGTVFIMNQGSKCTVINYQDSNHVTVKFDSGYITTTKWYRLVAGTVKDRMAYQINYLNEILDINPYDGQGEETKAYREFHNMHIRCFDEQYKIKRPTYKDVSCCEEWNYFSNYLYWRNQQSNLKYLEDIGGRFELDKDILKKGNRIYSPENCCLVPAIVNQVFNKHSRHRGELPIGVTWASNRAYVIAKWNDPIENKSKWSTTYPITPEGILTAFNEYKIHKEEIIKKVAQLEFNKKTITEECYEAMMQYEVEILD